MPHLTAGRGRRAAAVGLIFLVSASPAAAHDLLLSSRPLDSSVLAAPPEALTLTFDQALLRPGSVTTRGPAGAETQAAHLDPRDARRMIGPIVAGGPGAYAVSWTAVSADGHTIGGDVSFRVRPPSFAAAVRTLVDETADAARALAAAERQLRSRAGS
jgi:copper transport protein